MTSTLNALFDKLTYVAQTGKLSEGKELMLQYNGSDWLQYVCYKPTYYHKELVKCSIDMEMYIISWKSNTSSCIHDHPENGCIVKLLRGELQEDTYEKVDDDNTVCFISSRRMHENDIGYMESNKIVHSITNPTDDTCVSLHIYSKPLYVHTAYDKIK